MGGDKQSAGRSSHRKPNAFQDMGSFSYAESHRGNPQSEKNKLGHFSVAWKALPTREASSGVVVAKSVVS
jgi:hypothetical protein